MPDELAAALGYRAPRSTTREGRVSLLAECADALMRGELPSREAALWLGGGLSAWLETGSGSLDRHLRIAAPRGSHHKPQVLARKAHPR